MRARDKKRLLAVAYGALEELSLITEDQAEDVYTLSSPVPVEDLPLELFLRGIVHELCQDYGVEHDTALSIVQVVIESMIEEGDISEVPDLDADDDTVSMWVVNAIKIGLPDLCRAVARAL